MTLSPGNPMRVVLLSILIFEVIVFGLAIPVMILVSDVPPGSAVGLGGGAALLALVAAGLLRRPAGYCVGWVDPAGRGGPRFPDRRRCSSSAACSRPCGCSTFVLGKRLDDRPAAAGDLPQIGRALRPAASRPARR